MDVPESEPPPKGALHGFVRLVERSLVARFLVAAAALLGAVVAIVSGASRAYDAYDERFRWRARVERQLEALRANVSIEVFNDSLGTPRAVQSDPASDTRQYLYSGKRFWVQAIADADGSVVMFAVTVCEPALRPRWRVWDSYGQYQSITLNETTVMNDLSIPVSDYDWFASGATANSHVYALYYGGNPTDYQTYVWGYNDACEGEPSASADEWAALQEHPPTFDYARGVTPPMPRLVQAALRHTVSNTFGIFGVSQEPGTIGDWQIGADRIITRTLDDK